MLALAAALVVQLPPVQPFVNDIRGAVSLGNLNRMTRMFQNPADADYLQRAAAGRGGIRNYKVSVIPTPPGWEGRGSYWVVLHTRQDIEDYHDPVYPMIVSGSSWKLGPEIEEDAPVGFEIRDAALDVHLLPKTHQVQVRANLKFAPTGTGRAALFRLNENFRLNSTSLGSGRLVDASEAISKPVEGDVVRAGSLIIPWTKKIPVSASFDYSGTVNSSSEDKIDEKACYLTAWWVPSIGRLPFTTSTRVVGPSEWVLQSEGPAVAASDSQVKPSFRAGDGEQERFFRCDIPISYPKVIGGRYVVAAEKKVGKRTYRVYHFDMNDLARARRDLKTIEDSIAWYEQNLGPFPFDEYSCYDADTYYGIESYNYTLLRKNITSWAVGHEAGHTYFGGLVPCTYVHDSWNESMTQYVDSILRQNNSDQTLEAGYRTLGVKVPLTQMPVAHEYESATYMRGAVVLTMLSNQIGPEKMNQGIRALIQDRRGKDTTWYDLRPYFEAAYGSKLDWFWSQWISSAQFPTLQITDAQGIPTPSGTKVFITVRQSGTRMPYRLRFKVIAKGLNNQVAQVVEMRSPEASFELNLGNNKAYEASIETFGYVLCEPVPPAKVKT